MFTDEVIEYLGVLSCALLKDYQDTGKRNFVKQAIWDTLAQRSTACQLWGK